MKNDGGSDLRKKARPMIVHIGIEIVHKELIDQRCLSTKLSGDVHDYLQTFCSLARISLGGLSHTSFTGFQFLVLPDQRCGFLTLAVS
uniref:Uncharacterized protein n=2 Tax=Candidatus Kentrum sp. TUN TaxID=2126343 RepID=A0A451A8L7_9GAMM|nr:MAG: hypothetical protein BECKTUN1418E_GA0071001_10792 [Candidatus Kentron sp. TUN]